MCGTVKLPVWELVSLAIQTAFVFGETRVEKNRQVNLRFLPTHVADRKKKKQMCMSLSSICN